MKNLCTIVVGRRFLRCIRFLFLRSQLYFLKETVNVATRDGPAAKYIHVLCCLTAASMRQFPCES
ncbi:hypothetical protein [Kineothrix sedimenti]|uniref:Secreted protein n=1 Tax=Kineothrix sedimenti TaxID=3123317 RepID=A0ABZ3EXN7_9FIRM